MLLRWLLFGYLFSTKHLEILDDPLIKLPCLSTKATQQQPETSSHDYDHVVGWITFRVLLKSLPQDGVNDSINISVEMEKCDLWRHVSLTEKSPPPTIRVFKATQHQCTAV